MRHLRHTQTLLQLIQLFAVILEVLQLQHLQLFIVLTMELHGVLIRQLPIYQMEPTKLELKIVKDVFQILIRF